MHLMHLRVSRPSGEGEYGIHGLLWPIDSGDRPLSNHSLSLAGKKFLLNYTRENK
jgi:hypothetical protein